MRRRILCVSFDKTVCQDRLEALQQAGYEATGALTIDEAFRLLDAEKKFDLVIIGHRFSRFDKQALISEARERWHTPVLLVCGASAETELAADARVYALQGLEALVNAAAKLAPAAAAA